MKVDFFKPDDFLDLPVTQDTYHKLCAEQANKLLEERGVKIKVAELLNNGGYVTPNVRTPTHQALLINIQKLPKECVHEPAAHRSAQSGIVGFHCRNCGKPLKMPTKWEVEE